MTYKSNGRATWLIPPSSSASMAEPVPTIAKHYDVN